MCIRDRAYPDACLLLVDSYDTLRSGVPNAITVFKELREKGHEPLGIRLDSGDLAYPVSYTHLDVYKRQPRNSALTS